MAAILFCAGVLCSAQAADTVIAWGSNVYGETNIPAGLSDMIALAGGSYHVVALRSDQTALAWGRNSAGQTNMPPDAAPVVGISAGQNHSLALRPNGQAILWGRLPYVQATNAPPDATGRETK